MSLRTVHIDFYKQPKRRPAGINLPSGRAREPNDNYLEPRGSAEEALDAEPIMGNVLDPFCGGGNIVGACLSRGIVATGSDLRDRGYGEQRDAFSITESFDNLITNPPFSLIEDIIPHFLPLVRRKMVLMARINILEGIERRRLFDALPPARVWVSSRRVSCPPGHLQHPRDEYGCVIPLPASGGTTTYCWLVWDKSYEGPTIVGWLPREIDSSRVLRRRARPQRPACPATAALTLLPPEPVGASTPARGAAIAQQVLRIAKGGRVDMRDSAGTRWSGTTIVLLRETNVFDYLPTPTGSTEQADFTAERLERAVTPPANGRLTPVSIWQRVVPAVAAERSTQIVGALPKGEPITLQIPVHAALAWAAGPDGDLVVDAKSRRVFARDADGKVVGVGMALNESAANTATNKETSP
jgi:hypothetical protein